jgi:anti-sigma-K factor RskA
MSTEQEERIFDLLEKRTFDGLTEAEERELAEFNVGDDISLDLTASAIALASLGEVESMPARLRSKIEASADEYFDQKRAETARPNIVTADLRPPAGIWTWLGWAVAAAACIALAANIFLTRVNPPQAAGPGPTPAPSPARLTPEQMRQQFMASATDMSRADIGPGKESYKPTGEIVWSDAKQAGYVKISGLPKNDPSRDQYQLWIFDENQDPKTPVDGGVFNVSSDGEVVVPIDAKIKISRPKVFAITVEKPGGVVVSKQEKVAALAKVETNPA